MLCSVSDGEQPNCFSSLYTDQETSKFKKKIIFKHILQMKTSIFFYPNIIPEISSIVAENSHKCLLFYLSHICLIPFL